ncbi:MAG: gluconokinase [Acetobacteraceae bacterium]
MALVVVMMGVSGSGKTTIAQGVAKRLGWDVLEGDSYHPPTNIEKMSHGIALDDSDRWPWLHAIAEAIDAELAAGRSSIVACSALKRSYRDIIIGPRQDVVLVYLKGSHALLYDRIKHRTGHFMPASLLESQFQALEEPGEDEKPIVVSVDGTPEEIVDAVLVAMQARGLTP